MFDVLKFYADNRVVSAAQGHKHCIPGWVQTPCPFCTGNPGYHLGFNLTQGYFNCWRCGYHSKEEVIKSVVRCSWEQAKQIRRTYNDHIAVPKLKPTEHAVECKLPPEVRKVTAADKKYLESRGFDPDKIIQMWDLRNGGIVGRYHHRLMAPIYLDGELVSYQGRDRTGKSDLKYKACAKADEKYNHKDILYGTDLVPGDTIIIVEGIFDVWRLGPGAVCTFGIKYRREQVKFIKDRFNEAIILFDPDPQAIREGRRLAAELDMGGVETRCHLLHGKDPAELTQGEATKLKRFLTGIYF